MRCYPKMSIISFYKFLLILITWTINFSEEIKHTNESSSIDACRGKDVDLLWKVNEEENKIKKLEWYFNKEMICSSNLEDTFTVEPPYQGRIERIDKTGIRLKNVSIEDGGIYILFPLFHWSTSQEMRKNVCILEPPTNSCTCKMGHPPDFTSELTESYCGKPQVSFVWKRKQTFEVLGEGNLILNSTLQDKELLCCQDGEAMKCVDDNRQTEFCTTVSIPHQDTERPSEDGNTQHTDSVNIPGTDTGSTNIHHMQPFVLATLTVCLLTAVLIFVFFIKNCKKRKNNKDLEEEIVTMLEMKLHAAKPPIQDEEIVPMIEMKLSEVVIKDEPSRETKEAITVHHPTNDSETNIDVQTQQPSTLAEQQFIQERLERRKERRKKMREEEQRMAEEALYNDEDLEYIREDLEYDIRKFM